MGLDLAIRDMLRDEWAPDAWSTANPDLSEWVIIEDSLTRLFSMRGDDYYMYTTLSALQEFMYMFTDCFHMGATTCVSTFDWRDGVPKQKAVTQSKRTSDSALELYPTTSSFNEHGIQLPDCKTTERFDMRRVMRTRELRAAMCAAFLEILKKTFKKFVKPGQMFIFEFDNSGAYFFDGYAEECFHNTDTIHNHGESDKSVFYWASYFKGTKTQIRTIDTDVIAISMSYFSKQIEDKRPAQLTWKSHDNVEVNLVEMCKQAVEKSGLNLKAFILMCILCGTDFNSKPDLFAYIGFAIIYEEVKRSIKTWNEFQPPSSDEELNNAAYEKFETFVLNVYARVAKKQPIEIEDMQEAQLVSDKKRSFSTSTLKSNKRQKRANATNKEELRAHFAQKKRYRFPSDEKIRDAFANVHWNLVYWSDV